MSRIRPHSAELKLLIPTHIPKALPRVTAQTSQLQPSAPPNHWISYFTASLSAVDALFPFPETKFPAFVSLRALGGSVPPTVFVLRQLLILPLKCSEPVYGSGPTILQLARTITANTALGHVSQKTAPNLTLKQAQFS